MDIKITVKDKIAVLEEPARIVCGNTDYVAVFSFDEEWAHYELKTARFIHGGKHTDVPFTGDRCPIPKMRGVRSLYIGVYAGDLHTTTPAPVDCVKSIRCDSGTPAEPTPDVYAQIMEKIHEASRVYVLAEGETVEDAPADADLVIDPYGEGGIDEDDLAGLVRYNKPQVLTDEEKAQARENIGAASTEDVADVSRELSDYADAHKEDYTNAEIDKAISDAASNAGAAELVAKDLADYKAKNDAAVKAVQNGVAEIRGEVSSASNNIEGLARTFDFYQDAHKDDYSNGDIDGKVSEIDSKVSEVRTEIGYVSGNMEGLWSQVEGALSNVDYTIDGKVQPVETKIDNYISAHANDYTNAQIDQKIAASGGGSGGGGGTIDPETLTGFVRYDQSQILTPAEQIQAQDNIGAASASTVAFIVDYMSSYDRRTYEWNGDIGDRHSVTIEEEDGAAGKLVRVTDKVPQTELSNLFGTMTAIGYGDVQTAVIKGFEDMGGVWTPTEGPWVFIVPNDNTVVEGLGTFKKGVYFYGVFAKDLPFPLLHISSVWFAGESVENDVIINSSTEGSKKKFRITVDDNGTISATEVT